MGLRTMVAMAALVSACGVMGQEIFGPEAQQAAKVATAPGKISLQQGHLGNVFTVGEKVAITVQADTLVNWVARDGWGKVVRQGTQPAASGGSGKLELPLAEPGWYEVEVNGSGGNKAVTRIAVLSPFDPSAIKQTPCGMVTHFGQGWKPDVMEIFEKGGLLVTRDEIHWDAVEKTAGVFAIPERYSAYMSELSRHHIDPLLVLAFGNKLHYDVPDVPNWCAAPYKPEQYEAYARYCGELVKQAGSQVKNVEIWNEYNGAFAKGPAGGKSEVYVETLKAAYAAIKKERPDVMVWGLSTIGVPIDWIEDVFKRGGIECMDGITIHPYRYSQAPENMVPQLQKLHELIRQYNHGKDKPIWATEQSWYIIPDGVNGNRKPITESSQARYLVRSWAIQTGEGIEKSFWYCGRDYDAFPNIGLIGSEKSPFGMYAPKPVFVAYAALAREFADATAAGRQAAPDNVWDYRFEKSGGGFDVLWAMRPTEVTIASAGPRRVMDMLGHSITVHPIAGQLHLRLSDAPVYLFGEAVAVKPGSVFRANEPERSALGEEVPVTFAGEGSASKATLTLNGVESEVALNTTTTVNLPANAQKGDRIVPMQLVQDGKVIYAGFIHTYVEDPVKLDRYPRCVVADRLDVQVENISAKRPAQLTSVRWTVNGNTQTRQLTDLIPPGGNQTLALPVPAMQPFVTANAEVQLTLHDGTVLTSKCQVGRNPMPWRTLNIDGDGSDWKDLPSIDIGKCSYYKIAKKQWGGIEDLSGKAHFAADAANLYFIAEVQDDTFNQENAGYSTWQGDCIQLGFSTLPPWTGGEWLESLQEIGIALTPKGPEAFCTGGNTGPVAGAKVNITRNGTITLYRCAFPWRSLTGKSEAPAAVSLAFYLNDNDGAGRKGFLQWSDIKHISAMQWCPIVKP